MTKIVRAVFNIKGKLQIVFCFIHEEKFLEYNSEISPASNMQGSLY